MSWAVLLGLSGLLASAGIKRPEIDEFVEHLWAWSLVGPDSFDEWYKSRPALVDTAMGDPMPQEIEQAFARAGIGTDDAQQLVESSTEVIYANLFAAITWKWVEEQFDKVAHVLARYEAGLPPASVLPESTRSEQNGWGRRLEASELHAIRSIVWPTPYRGR